MRFQQSCSFSVMYSDSNSQWAPEFDVFFVFHWGISMKCLAGEKTCFFREVGGIRIWDKNFGSLFEGHSAVCIDILGVMSHHRQSLNRFIQPYCNNSKSRTLFSCKSFPSGPQGLLFNIRVFKQDTYWLENWTAFTNPDRAHNCWKDISLHGNQL